MKQKRLFLKTALILVLSLSLLTGGMLHIFASDLSVKDVSDEALAPDVAPPPTGDQTLDSDDATIPPDGSDLVIDDGSKPVTLEQLSEKFGVYTTVTEENGQSVVTLFSEEQIAALKALRENGGNMLLTGQEMLYLLDDTKRLFEEYDIVRVRDLDGTVYSYPGVSFYTSGAFDAAFSNVTGGVSNELSYDLKNDAYEAMIYRIKVLHSYSEFICYREDIECMYTYTEWDGFTGEDPRVLAEGISRHATYSGRFNVARNYAQGDDGSDGGRYPYIPQMRLNLIRSTPGAMLVFFGEEIFYIDDMSTFDGTNMVILYPDGIFPGGTVTGKYENGDGLSVVIEVWEEASKSCIARIRLDDQTDAAQVQKIAQLWNGMKDIRTRGGEKLGAVPAGDYRVAVYLCGFEHKLLEGGSEQACFWYKPGAEPDLWSLIWWDDVMNFFSDNFIGAAEMTEYINGILAERLTK